MNGKSKLTHRQREQTEARQDQQQQSQQQAGRSFDTVDQMLRFDAEQNPVPEAVAERLQQSVAAEQLDAPQPWWKRWWRRRSPEP